MSVLAVDEVMLREPRLLVPGMQPLGPVKVDRDHPLGRNCRAAVVFGGRRLVEICSGITATITGSPALSSRAGITCWAFNGSSDAVSIPLNLTGSAAATCVMSVYPDAWPGSYNMYYESSASPYFTLYNAVGAASTRIGHNGNVGYNERSASQPPATTWSQLAGLYDFTQAAATEVKFALNGVLQSTSSTASAENTGTFSSNTLHIAARTSGSLWFDGGYQYLFVFDCILTEAQLLSLKFDPYQLLIPA